MPAKGDVRSNVHANGTIEEVEISDDVLQIAEAVRPKLIQDGLFLVGLDIIGDRVLEINVFTPGNLWSISDMQGVDFAETVIQSLEQKVQMRKESTSPYPIGNWKSYSVLSQGIGTVKSLNRWTSASGSFSLDSARTSLDYSSIGRYTGFG